MSNKANEKTIQDRLEHVPFSELQEEREVVVELTFGLESSFNTMRGSELVERGELREARGRGRKVRLGRTSRREGDEKHQRQNRNRRARLWRQRRSSRRNLALVKTSGRREEEEKSELALLIS